MGQNTEYSWRKSIFTIFSRKQGCANPTCPNFQEVFTINDAVPDRILYCTVHSVQCRYRSRLFSKWKWRNLSSVGVAEPEPSEAELLWSGAGAGANWRKRYLDDYILFWVQLVYFLLNCFLTNQKLKWKKLFVDILSSLCLRIFFNLLHVN